MYAINSEIWSQPTPSEAGLPNNVLREINQAAVASNLQHDEGPRGTGSKKQKLPYVVLIILLALARPAAGA